ncbi:glycoside hydrolase family 92 protein [Photobacterium phosphoreum]|uniref:Glycoside hydrolase family 92 protein n=1 Tax=Photobacterium phosphoreum TaxID=659 RepID=A0A2T3JWE0_PHOPO|nr:GH92 family glycosyl hydrolase [Photobacterium phosphoreum]PSU26697.1 glycoside hydrolase family 92 protein [Photobacterium phosphoreum]PSU43408.1 glycoside hydrolase family 92 protein [Photobacterium phosphoreum]PSU53644.1 glycoside hydrolase family 92 protein [Photobacterium phosphoreum]
MSTMKIMPLALMVAAVLAGCNNETINNNTTIVPDKDRPAIELTGNTKFVDPFIGTGFNGHTFPGAVVPEGMIQLSPDTELMGWHSSSGYHYDKDTLFGFSHTHLSGTGMGGLGDILFLPFTEENQKYIEDNDDYRKAIAVKMDKTSEHAEVGYYSVEIADNNIKAELTASERVGFHRYTYPQGADQKLKIDLNSILNSDWGSTSLRNQLTVSKDGYTISGERDAAHFSGWAKNQKIFFHATFDKKIKNVVILANGKAVDGLTAEHVSELLRDDAGKPVKRTKADVTAYVEFESGDTQIVNAAVAISAVSADGAKANHDAEGQQSFDEARMATVKKWQRALNFDVKGGTADQKEIFYTALYHTKIAPQVHQDVTGEFRGMGKGSLRNGEGNYSIAYGQATAEQPNFSVYSLWDTFRALHPLKTITEPERAVQYAKNMVQKWQESGLLPKWEHLGDETGTMIGYPSVAVIADAITKFPNEFTLQEKQQALQAAVESSTYDEHTTLAQEWDLDVLKRVLPDAVKFSQQHGFVPVTNENAENIKESVSYGLENAFYDWAIAQIAKAAGNIELEQQYLARSQAFKRYFDNNSIEYAEHGVSGFMRPLTIDGDFITPFDPYKTAHESGPYAEGNAWQWTWFVPHDIKGLQDKMGGQAAFAKNLDATFTAGSEGTETADMSGMIGQVAFGNEPSHHIPYLYNWTAEPWKTQEVVDYILDEMYFAEPAGIIGNEDVGSMSAWYVMSAMGFYQVNAAEPVYTVGRPLFDEVRLPVKDGFFTVKALNNADDNMYIKSVSINGKPLDKGLFFNHAEFKAGGELKFVMTGDKSQAMILPIVE